MPRLNITAQNAFRRAIQGLYTSGLVPNVLSADFTPQILLDEADITVPTTADADLNVVSEAAFKACLQFICDMPDYVDSGTILEIAPGARFPFNLAYVAADGHAATLADVTAIQECILAPKLSLAHRSAIFQTLATGPNIKKTDVSTNQLKKILYTFSPLTSGRLSERELMQLLSIVSQEEAQRLTINYEGGVWPIVISASALQASIFLPKISYNQRVTICRLVMRRKDWKGSFVHFENERALVSQQICLEDNIDIPNNRTVDTIANHISDLVLEKRRNTCWSICNVFCRCLSALCCVYDDECCQSPLPFQIDPAHSDAALAKSFKHDYMRHKQSSQVLSYWPIAAAFILGVLGAIQTLLSSVPEDKRPSGYVQGFGLAQTVLGLTTTLVAGVAGIVKLTAEQKLRNYTHDLCSSPMQSYASFFTEQDLNGNETKILSRLGLVPRETPNS